MNWQQKLSDIHELVTYIKKQVDTGPQGSTLKKLEQMERSIQDLGNLADIRGITGQAEPYGADLEQATNNMLSSLSVLTAELKENRKAKDEVFLGIHDMYAEYAKALQEATGALKAWQEEQAEGRKSLDKKLKELGDTLSKMEGHLENGQGQPDASMQQQFAGMEERDEKAYAMCQDILETAKSLGTAVQESYAHLAARIEHCEDTFYNTSMRLDALLEQATIPKRKRGWK